MNMELREDYRRLLSQYREMRRENKEFGKEHEEIRKDNEDLRKENEKMRRHLALHDNANTPPSRKMTKHRKKTAATR